MRSRTTIHLQRYRQMRLHNGREALGGFIQHWAGAAVVVLVGGGGGDHSTQFQIRIKQKATSTVRRLFFFSRNRSIRTSLPRAGSGGFV